MLKVNNCGIIIIMAQEDDPFPDPDRVAQKESERAWEKINPYKQPAHELATVVIRAPSAREWLIAKLEEQFRQEYSGDHERIV